MKTADNTISFYKAIPFNIRGVTTKCYSLYIQNSYQYSWTSTYNVYMDTVFYSLYGKIVDYKYFLNKGVKPWDLKK